MLILPFQNSKDTKVYNSCFYLLWDLGFFVFDSVYKKFDQVFSKVFAHAKNYRLNDGLATI